MESMQQRNAWKGVSVAVLLCAMALAGVVAVGLGFSLRFGAVSSSLLGLCFVVGTGLAASVLLYNRTRAVPARETEF
jgi:hypothetical protein